MSATTRIIAIVLVVLALLLGILAIFVGRRPAPPVGTPVASAPVMASFPVVIATRPLDAGVTIALDAVRVVQLPVQPTGAYVRLQDVVGHIPRVAIASGMPLTEGGLNQGLPLTLKPGERAVAVPVDEIAGVGNAVQAGDYVDLFFTMRAPDPSMQSNERTVARLILSRVRVLAYGADSLVPTTAAANRDAARSQARSAVLAVPVQDVDQVIVATQSGKVTMALRYPQDTQLPDPELFPSPKPLLTAKSSLSAQAITQMSAPENKAYAGVDSLSLVGVGGASAYASRTGMAPLPGLTATNGDAGSAESAGIAGSRGRAARGARSEAFIEVIRGSDVKHETLGGADAAAMDGARK